MILGYAKKVKVEKKVSRTEGGSRIRVWSSGYKNGKKNSYATITVEDKEIVTRESSKRGFNVVALNGADHSVIYSKSYNTHKKKSASTQMKKDWEELPKGTIIIAAVKDDGKRKLTASGRRMFMNMGAKKIWKLGYKKAWAFVGVKGMKKSAELYEEKSASFGVIMGYV